MRTEIKEALVAHALGQKKLHAANAEVYMQNPAGIGEHSDILEAIQKELDAMAAANDRLEMLEELG